MSYGPQRVDIYGIVRSALVCFSAVGYFSVSSGGVKLVKLWYCIYALVQHRVLLYCDEVYCKVQRCRGYYTTEDVPYCLI